MQVSHLVMTSMVTLAIGRLALACETIVLREYVFLGSVTL